MIDPTKVNVTFVPSDGSAGLPVLVNGEPEKVDEERAKEILSLEDFEVLVEMGMGGEGEAQYWTCDFSYVSVACVCVCESEKVSSRARQASGRPRWTPPPSPGVCEPNGRDLMIDNMGEGPGNG